MLLVKYQEDKNCRDKGQFSTHCSHKSQQIFHRRSTKLPLTKFWVSYQKYRRLRAMKFMERKGFAILSVAVMNLFTLVFCCINPISFCKTTSPAIAEKVLEGDFLGAVSTWYNVRRSLGFSRRCCTQRDVHCYECYSFVPAPQSRWTQFHKSS